MAGSPPVRHSLLFADLFAQVLATSDPRDPLFAELGMFLDRGRNYAMIARGARLSGPSMVIRDTANYLLMIKGGNGLWLKSKQSSMLFADASRLVSEVRPKAVSTSFNGDVKSYVVWITVPPRE